LVFASAIVFGNGQCRVKVAVSEFVQVSKTVFVLARTGELQVKEA